MKNVYILTITDKADFGRVKHHSIWRTYARALQCAQEVTKTLAQKGKEDPRNLGNTYNTDIIQMEVQT